MNPVGLQKKRPLEGYHYLPGTRLELGKDPALIIFGDPNHAERPDNVWMCSMSGNEMVLEGKSPEMDADDLLYFEMSSFKRQDAETTVMNSLVAEVKVDAESSIRTKSLIRNLQPAGHLFRAMPVGAAVLETIPPVGLLETSNKHLQTI